MVLDNTFVCLAHHQPRLQPCSPRHSSLFMLRYLMCFTIGICTHRIGESPACKVLGWCLYCTQSAGSLIDVCRFKQLGTHTHTYTHSGPPRLSNSKICMLVRSETALQRSGLLIYILTRFIFAAPLYLYPALEELFNQRHVDVICI